MGSYAEIVRNTLSGILRSKILFVVLFLTVIIAVISVVPYMMIQMAAEAGEGEAARALKADSVVGMFGLWTTAAYAMALFFGATAISSEVKTKTIVTVLSKPVDRWKFMVAKWVGIQLFLFGFLAAGLLAVAVMLQLYDAEVSNLFWLGMAKAFLNVTIVGTAALALATVTSPVFSACFPILLSVLAEFVDFASNDPSIWLRGLAKGFYLLMPAAMPANLLGQSIRSEALNPEWGLFTQVLLENGGYALALLTVGCVIFSTRPLRLR